MSRSDDEGTAGAPAATVPATADTLPASAPLPATGARTLEPGDLVGRYRLVARLGAGAMGVVWEAEDPQLDRRIAIKVVHPRLARDTAATTRLLREARAMAKLSHRSVVTVHDAVEVDGRLFLAMELVEGTTLGQLLRARTPDALADWRRWLGMMIAAGEGLAAAHRRGVLHRDFKPDNVLVDTDGRVCVGDFGLAALGADARGAASGAASAAAADGELTATGSLLGTPVYMSPQQLRGEAIDARADQFAFCVACFEALYGVRPFRAGPGLAAIASLAEQIECGAIAAPPAGAPVPTAVHDAVCRGLAAEPDARWPDMDALLGALRAAAVPAAPARARRHRAIAIAAAVGVAGLAAAVTLAVRGRRVPAPIAEPLFRVPVRTNIAVSPDGRRIALGNARLEVRDLTGTHRSWVTDLSAAANYVELDGDTVRFGAWGTPRMMRWRYAAGAPVEAGPELDGEWYGRTTRGDVAVTRGLSHTEIHIVDGGRIVARRAAATYVEVFAVSPDRRRVAYLQPAGRFGGTIQVWDVTRDVVASSGLLINPAALWWLDDRTLVFSTGSQVDPTLWRMAVNGASLGPPTAIYRAPTGWFAELRAHVDADRAQIYMIDMQPESRTRLLVRDGPQVSFHALDAVTATVVLGWVNARELLVWSKDTHAVERRTTDRPGQRLAFTLPTEPIDTTLAGDLLITAVRTMAGRDVIAHAISSTAEAPLWHSTSLFAVRCAADRTPPCYAIIDGGGAGDRVVAIDPRTGATGAEVYRARTVEDLAVSPGGHRLLLVDRTRAIRSLDLRTGEIETIDIAGAPGSRSIAFDPLGGMLIGATIADNRYAVGRIADGRYTALDETENDLLALVRPSPDGARVAILARAFAPEVVRLTVPH